MSTTLKKAYQKFLTENTRYLVAKRRFNGSWLLDELSAEETRFELKVQHPEAETDWERGAEDSAFNETDPVELWADLHPYNDYVVTQDPEKLAGLRLGHGEQAMLAHLLQIAGLFTSPEKEDGFPWETIEADGDTWRVAYFEELGGAGIDLTIEENGVEVYRAIDSDGLPLSDDLYYGPFTALNRAILEEVTQ